MINVSVHNINEALPIALTYFRDPRKVIKVMVRGRERVELIEPFATTYTQPQQRVLFSAVRDANPFFHLMESLWILAGRRDVEWLRQWLDNIVDYSDDGIFFHGAYGARLYEHGQMGHVVKRLRKDPHNTRTVLQLYDASIDAAYEGKDMPCNCTIFLIVRDERLNLTVCNRSNDLVWGAYGANVVQFSMLQEYIAAQVGVGIGTYTQFSNNTHLYPDNRATQRCMDNVTPIYDDPYFNSGLTTMPLCTSTYFYKDLAAVMSNDWSHPYREPFFKEVVMPMVRAYLYHHSKIYTAALQHIRDGMPATNDWAVAATAWLQRRAGAMR